MTLKRGSLAIAVALLLGAGLRLSAQNPAAGPFPSTAFEAYLELLRQQAGIPGMSAAVIQDREIVWERGFGFQDVEARIHATPDTPYLVGDISQAVASVLLLQCVEQRRFALDDGAARYGAKLEDQATLRQVLSHAAPDSNGGTFRYDPERFAQLTFAMEWCAPQAYRKSVSHRILERMAMRDSVPGTDLQNSSVVPEEMWDPAMLERYKGVLERLAVPYRIDKKGKAVRSELPPPHGVNAAAGLVTTVRDLARFDQAVNIREGLETEVPLLLDSTWAAAWRPLPGKDGLMLPTGLGWFVQTYKGEPVVWHFGNIPNAYSALYIKLPARRLTFVLLANSDRLVAPYQLSAGDVTKSVFATLFLRMFT